MAGAPTTPAAFIAVFGSLGFGELLSVAKSEKSMTMVTAFGLSTA